MKTTLMLLHALTQQDVRVAQLANGNFLIIWKNSEQDVGYMEITVHETHLVPR